MVCPHGQDGRGVELVRTFFGKGAIGVNFSQFCADIFYEPKNKILDFSSTKWFMRFGCISISGS